MCAAVTSRLSSSFELVCLLLFGFLVFLFAFLVLTDDPVTPPPAPPAPPLASYRGGLTRTGTLTAGVAAILHTSPDSKQDFLSALAASSH